MWLYNKIKKAYWNRGLLLILLIFSVIPIITSITIEVSLFKYSSSLVGAITYILMGCLMIILGYNSLKHKYYKTHLTVSLDKKYLLIMGGLAILGAVVALKTLTAVADISMLQNMYRGENVSDVRTEMGNSGLGGIVKMFACMPLCVFLINSSIFFFTTYDSKSYRIISYVTIISTITALFKVAIYFDRLTLLAMLLVFLYHFFYNTGLNKIIKIIVVVALFLFASVVTALRMDDISLAEFLGSYFNLGVINLQVVMDKQQEFNYLLTETFLSPLSFICRFFDIPFHSEMACDYVWNPAQSFWGFYFVDLNYLGLFFLPILGRVIKYLEINKMNNPFCCCFYFIAMYGLFSFCVVPIIRSIEFWLMILTCLFVTKYIRIFK